MILFRYTLYNADSDTPISETYTVKINSTASTCQTSIPFNFPLVQVSGKKYVDCANMQADGNPTIPLANANFQLTGNGLTLSATSDASGNFKFLVPPSSSYTVTETSAPKGYQKDISSQTVTVGETTADNSVTFYNVPQFNLTISTTPLVSSPTFSLKFTVQCTTNGVTTTTSGTAAIQQLMYITAGTTCTIDFPADVSQCPP